MKHLAVIIACTTALGACNKSPEVHQKNASVEQVANAVSASGVANGLHLRAGEWRVTATVEEMNIPGLPPEAQSQMKQVMSKRGDSTYQYCLTPEQAKEPGGKFFNRQADKSFKGSCCRRPNNRFRRCGCL